MLISSLFLAGLHPTPTRGPLGGRCGGAADVLCERSGPADVRPRPKLTTMTTTPKKTLPTATRPRPYPRALRN